MTWRVIFAAGLLCRPALILPMAPSGPLAGSDLLPVAFGAVVLGSAFLAGGAVARIRLVLLLAIVTAVLGVPIAVIGIVVGLAMPWPLILLGYNAALVPVGVLAWRELPSGRAG